MALTQVRMGMAGDDGSFADDSAELSNGQDNNQYVDEPPAQGFVPEPPDMNQMLSQLRTKWANELQQI